MTYTELLDTDATETELREFLSDGEATAITFRIPRNLKDAIVEGAALRGMSYSAFIRMCMMSELVKKG